MPATKGLSVRTRAQLTRQLIGNIDGQLVGLGPHHAEPGRQGGHAPTDQSGLARTRLAFHPHHPRSTRGRLLAPAQL